MGVCLLYILMYVYVLWFVHALYVGFWGCNPIPHRNHVLNPILLPLPYPLPWSLPGPVPSSNLARALPWP